LAQAYGIIKQHNGEIVVTSQVGQGAHFNIYLPALPEQVSLHALVGPPKSNHGDGEAILIVEDDQMAREATKAMLDHLGYRVLAATNGQEALKIYDRHQGNIDLIITDLTMPGLSGPDLAEALKSRNPAIKILIITGYSLEGQEQALAEQELVDWMPKPVSLKQLAHKVTQMLADDRSSSD